MSAPPKPAPTIVTDFVRSPIASAQPRESGALEQPREAPDFVEGVVERHGRDADDVGRARIADDAQRVERVEASPPAGRGSAARAGSRARRCRAG